MCRGVHGTLCHPGRDCIYSTNHLPAHFVNEKDACLESRSDRLYLWGSDRLYDECRCAKTSINS